MLLENDLDDPLPFGLAAPFPGAYSEPHPRAVRGERTTDKQP
jgi:hypothetical protein